MITSGIMTDILGTKQMFLIFLEPGCEGKIYSHEIHREKSSTTCIDYQYNSNSKKKIHEGCRNERNLAEWKGLG